MPPACDGAAAKSGGRGPADGRERTSPDGSAGETTEGAVELAESCLCEDSCTTKNYNPLCFVVLRDIIYRRVSTHLLVSFKLVPNYR